MNVPKSNVTQNEDGGRSRGPSIFSTTADDQTNIQTELQYPTWWSREGILSWYRDLPDNTIWNCYICAAVLVAIVWVGANLQSIYFDILDAIYNISYVAHVLAIAYKMLTEKGYTEMTFLIFVRFIIDIGTYSHYLVSVAHYKLGCYYLRLHRPFNYLWSLYDYNLQGCILGTTLKYCYIFMVLRITWAWVWHRLNLLQQQFSFARPRITRRRMNVRLTDFYSNDSDAAKFLSSLYIVNKMFIPIGIPVVPDNDIERVTCLFVILSGCLVVTGAAVATLSLVISLYMSPEETFRSRYKLIIKEMKDASVPLKLREKVQKFYRMYWHKQRAVSETKLLPIFPPTLPATVYTDIYFEAMQKSRLLRDLPYQFLSELAKKMETIHYIPGDAIIKRTHKKSDIIFITYGDIEMLTAEDDTTAILRFTRGTILSPCGGAAAAAISRSHLAVRAATFCTAHVLHAADLWRTVYKYSVGQDHRGQIQHAFAEHIERVKRHYYMKIPVASLYKSSILHFNRNLLALKEMKDANGLPLFADTDVFLEIAGCYIMRNRLDSTLTDESDAICLRPTFPCILQPSSSLLIAWNTLVACLILTICITHPYYLVFVPDVPIEFRFFDYMASLIYGVDLIVHLSTGAHVEEGVPITFAQTSSQQMRSKWFVLDVFSIVPIFEFIGEGHFAGINKIMRLPKVFRLLKSMEDSCVYHSNLLRFCSYTLVLLIACYLTAAMQQAFMCFQSGYCLVTNFTHSPFWEKKPLDMNTVEASLTFGLYWAISMIMFTTHMETWGKENMTNVMYTMMILEICIVLRTFMEALYSATIMVTTAMREDYDARIATVKQFLIRNEVDPELRKRFITYLRLCWYTDKAYKMTHHAKTASIFYDLPQHVYQDIVGRNRIKYILCIPFMKMLNKEELKQLASTAHLYYTSPNEILMNTGDLVNEIYVLVKGICEVISPKTQKRIAELTAKCHFGTVVCVLRIPSYYTIRAVTNVQIFCISLRHMKPVFENPQIKEAIEYVKSQPVYTRLQRCQPSFLKYEPLPPIPNTERFPLPRKHEPDFAYLHPFKRLGFMSILRYIFPRFTIRPDGKYLIRYEWFRVSCALMSAILFPNYSYLVLQWPWLFYFTWLLDLSAFFDIFQRMLVGYYNEDGILVYHPSSTAANYMRGPFIVDLIACLPLEKLETERIETYANGYRVTPMEQGLMMNRLLQLYRFPSIMQTLQFYIERRDIHMIIYAIPLFISMFNILTSLMIFNSVKIFYFINDNGELRWLLEPFQDQGGSWIYLFRNTFRFNLTSSPWNLYLATHFWVVYETTTTGYAKFKPSNHHQMKILFIGMAMSAMIITYFSVRIISIRANVNKPLAGFKQHMRDISVFMNREKLNPKLQSELRRYYEYNWEKMRGINYRSMLKLCNQITLRTDAILHIYGPTFAKCPLLANCDVSLLRMIGRSVRSVYFLRDMKIVELDDVVKDVYFVDYGRVESRVSIGDMEQNVRLPRGSVFGNLGGIPSQRIPMNIVATSRLHLLMINSQAFYHIINEFPDTQTLLERSRQKDNKYYILGNMADFKVKLTRERPPPKRNIKLDIMKYIAFQEGLVLLYLILVSLASIYLDLYNAGFQDNRAWLILTLYILDMCFFYKILIQFSLPLLFKNKSIKAVLLPIQRMYFKTDFKYDLLSCVPIELISFPITNRRWFWFSWLRLNRMFRIATVHSCLKQRKARINVNLIVITILAVSIWFSVFVHATTCLWYFIGMVEEEAQPKSSWIYNDNGMSWCGNEYICSLYFILTTFTQNGVGDIMPKKQSEVIFVTILMIISTMVFMIYVGEFSNIIQYQSFRSFSSYSEYLELQEFMKNNRVSRNLVNIVNKYTLHLWREGRGLQVPHFLVNAPLSLRLRVMSAAYMHHITKHQIFKDCEPAFLRQLVGCLRLYRYNEDMYVVKQNEITNCMYVIHKGKVKETTQEDNMEGAFPTIYTSGYTFGILQGLVRDTPYTHSYQTTIKSQVLTLPLDDWEYLLAHFPQSKDTIHKNMKNGKYGDVDPSKYPGGVDPDPPPGGIAAQTETEGNTSNLPQFFPYNPLKPFGLVPSASKDLSLSIDMSLFEISPHHSNITLNNKAASSTSTYKTNKSDETESIKNSEIGIKAKVVNVVRKLMGRYSDTNLGISESDAREEFLQDEEVTGTVLKRLDEASRLSRETKRKSLSRSDKRKRSISREEDKEKYLLELDLDDEDEKSPKGESKKSLSLQLRILDDNNPSTDTAKLETIQMVNIMTPATGSHTDFVDKRVKSETNLDQNQGIPMQNIDSILSPTVAPVTSVVAVANSETTSLPIDFSVWGNIVKQEIDADLAALPNTHDTTTNESIYGIEPTPDTTISAYGQPDTNVQPVLGTLKKSSYDSSDSDTNTDAKTAPVIEKMEMNLEASPNSDGFTAWGTRVTQEIDADVAVLPDTLEAKDILPRNSGKSLYVESELDVTLDSVKKTKQKTNDAMKTVYTDADVNTETQIKTDIQYDSVTQIAAHVVDTPTWGAKVKQEIDADVAALPEARIIKDIHTPVDSRTNIGLAPVPDTTKQKYNLSDVIVPTPATQQKDNRELRDRDTSSGQVPSDVDIENNQIKSNINDANMALENQLVTSIQVTKSDEVEKLHTTDFVEASTSQTKDTLPSDYSSKLNKKSSKESMTEQKLKRKFHRVSYDDSAWGNIVKQEIDADIASKPDTHDVRDAPENDIKPVPDTIKSAYSQPDADIQPIPSTLKKSSDDTSDEFKEFPIDADTASDAKKAKTKTGASPNPVDFPAWGSRVTQQIDADVAVLPDTQETKDILPSTTRTSLYVESAIDNAGNRLTPDTIKKAKQETSETIKTVFTDADVEVVPQIKPDMQHDSNTELSPHMIDSPTWGARVKQEVDADVAALPESRIITDVLRPVDSRTKIDVAVVPDPKKQRYYQSHINVQPTPATQQQKDDYKPRDHDTGSGQVSLDLDNNQIKSNINDANIALQNQPVTSIQAPKSDDNDKPYTVDFTEASTSRTTNQEQSLTEQKLKRKFRVRYDDDDNRPSTSRGHGQVDGKKNKDKQTDAAQNDDHDTSISSLKSKTQQKQKKK